MPRPLIRMGARAGPNGPVGYVFDVRSTRIWQIGVGGVAVVAGCLRRIWLTIVADVTALCGDAVGTYTGGE